MDAAGIGDAALSTGETTDAYSRRNLEDARAGLRWLEARTGTGVVVVGLCSGAYVGLQITAEPCVRGLVLLNLQRFVWQEGTSLKVVQRNTKRTTEFYRRNLRTLAVWRRILRGDVDLAGIAGALVGRAGRRLRAAADPLLSAGSVPSRYGQVRGWFRDLARRGIPVLYVLSFNDPGLDELEEYFGVSGTRLRRLGNVRLHRIENADHTLTHRCARDELFAHMQLLLDEVVPQQHQAAPRQRALAAA